jgi:HEPN domain-containing protein
LKHGKDAAMNRLEWQRMAKLRLADAKALLAARRWSAAYYLAGYAVECALKSCVLARMGREVEIIFKDRKFSDKCWTHDLEALLSLAALKADLDAAASADAELKNYWATVIVWEEGSRYDRWTKKDSEDLIQSVADKKHGVLRWIMSRW